MARLLTCGQFEICFRFLLWAYAHGLPIGRIRRHPEDVDDEAPPRFLAVETGKSLFPTSFPNPILKEMLSLCNVW